MCSSRVGGHPARPADAATVITARADRPAPGAATAQNLPAEPTSLQRDLGSRRREAVSPFLTSQVLPWTLLIHYIIYIWLRHFRLAMSFHWR